MCYQRHVASSCLTFCAHINHYAFMYWIVPKESKSCMNLIGHDATILVEFEWVNNLIDSIYPQSLNFFAPSFSQVLIHVHTNAHVKVFGYQCQCAVTRLVISPREYLLLIHSRTALLCKFNCIVSRACIKNQNYVRIFG